MLRLLEPFALGENRRGLRARSLERQHKGLGRGGQSVPVTGGTSRSNSTLLSGTATRVRGW
jgi:hypothetical protein